MECTTKFSAMGSISEYTTMEELTTGGSNWDSSSNSHQWSSSSNHSQWGSSPNTSHWPSSTNVQHGFPLEMQTRSII